MRHRVKMWRVLFGACLCGPVLAEDDPFAGFTRAWRDDPLWYDGQAEVAVYDATRTIYGKRRHYAATLYTNKEHASPQTFTKSADDGGRSVFKQHLRQDISTDNYTYHFSTMCYVGTDDLKSLKIDMGSQEDCGATFKQYVNHGGTCHWRQSSYFPKEGHAFGSYKPSSSLAFQDALSLILRGYPFKHPQVLVLDLLPDQTSNRFTPSTTGLKVVRYEGLQSLELPIGKTMAHHLKIERTEPNLSSPAHHYWFAADPDLRHVMVQYEGPGGITCKLRSLERRAYWRR